MIRFVSIVLLAAVAAAPLSAQQPRPEAPPGEVIGVGNFAHIVADLDASLVLYRDVLAARPTYRCACATWMRCSRKSGKCPA